MIMKVGVKGSGSPTLKLGIKRRRFMKKKRYIILLIIIFCILFLTWYFIKNTSYFPLRASKDRVKIGILHSLTGDLAISEKPVADAALLAIKEINTAGGILQRQIEPSVVDGKSDAQIFAQ